MMDQFVEFLKSPNRESFFALRNILLASEHYDPYSDPFNRVLQLLDAGELGEAQEAISTAMPNLLLSPRAHLMSAVIAEKAGDERHAQAERFIAAACAEGMVATGNGSKDTPYAICRISDEHDILEYLGKTFSDQSLVHDGDRHLDVMNCKDGTEVWFDITEPYNKLEERLRPRGTE